MLRRACLWQKKKNRKCPHQARLVDSQETRVEAFAWQGTPTPTASSWLKFQAWDMKNLADKLSAIKPSRGARLEKGFVMSGALWLYGLRNEGGDSGCCPAATSTNTKTKNKKKNSVQKKPKKASETKLKNLYEKFLRFDCSSRF